VSWAGTAGLVLSGIVVGGLLVLWLLARVARAGVELSEARVRLESATVDLEASEHLRREAEIAAKTAEQTLADVLRQP
jgi:hypothetical protein